MAWVHAHAWVVTTSTPPPTPSTPLCSRPLHTSRQVEQDPVSHLAHPVLAGYLIAACLMSRTTPRPGPLHKRGRLTRTGRRAAGNRRPGTSPSKGLGGGGGGAPLHRLCLRGQVLSPRGRAGRVGPRLLLRAHQAAPPLARRQADHLPGALRAQGGRGVPRRCVCAARQPPATAPPFPTRRRGEDGRRVRTRRTSAPSASLCSPRPPARPPGIAVKLNLLDEIDGDPDAAGPDTAHPVVQREFGRRLLLGVSITATFALQMLMQPLHTSYLKNYSLPALRLQVAPRGADPPLPQLPHASDTHNSDPATPTTLLCPHQAHTLPPPTLPAASPAPPPRSLAAPPSYSAGWFCSAPRPPSR